MKGWQSIVSVLPIFTVPTRTEVEEAFILYSGQLPKRRKFVLSCGHILDAVLYETERGAGDPWQCPLCAPR